MRMKFKVGDVVKLDPEWCSDYHMRKWGDGDFVVVKLNSTGFLTSQRDLTDRLDSSIEPFHDTTLVCKDKNGLHSPTWFHSRLMLSVQDYKEDQVADEQEDLL